MGAPLTPREWALPPALGPQSTHGGCRGERGRCQPRLGGKAPAVSPPWQHGLSMGRVCATAPEPPDENNSASCRGQSGAAQREAAGRAGGALPTRPRPP